MEYAMCVREKKRKRKSREIVRERVEEQLLLINSNFMFLLPLIWYIKYAAVITNPEPTPTIPKKG